MNLQREFNFRGARSESGYSNWLLSRKLAAQDLALQINLPIGHQVEVWLFGGIRLRGKLRLKEELLHIEKESAGDLELLVDHVLFSYREMESCVRLDESD